MNYVFDNKVFSISVWNDLYPLFYDKRYSNISVYFNTNSTKNKLYNEYEVFNCKLHFLNDEIHKKFISDIVEKIIYFIYKKNRPILLSNEEIYTLYHKQLSFTLSFNHKLGDHLMTFKFINSNFHTGNPVTFFKCDKLLVNKYNDVNK